MCHFLELHSLSLFSDTDSEYKIFASHKSVEKQWFIFRHPPHILHQMRQNQGRLRQRRFSVSV